MSPLYTPVIEWLPAASADVENTATPLPTVAIVVRDQEGRAERPRWVRYARKDNPEASF